MLTLGGRGGEDQGEWQGDILVPIFQTSPLPDQGQVGLFFINPRTTLSHDSEEEFNLALGYRHLFVEKEIILGANVYYDSRWTSHDNQFDQVGFGLEFLSKDVPKNNFTIWRVQ